METQYNFFNGFSKFKFGLNFKFKIFIPVLIVLLLIIWIGFLSFVPAFILSLLFSLVITIIVAYSKTGTIDCYTIDGKNYILYNKNIYLKDYFHMDESSLLNVNYDKYQPKNVGFINIFLNDFIKSVEKQSNTMWEYFSAFKKIDIDDVNYVFVYAENSDQDIKEVFRAVCALDIKNRSKDDIIEILTMLGSIISQGDLDLIKAKVGILSEKITEKRNENNEIFKKWGIREPEKD
jgi:hypothetical protein